MRAAGGALGSILVASQEEREAARAGWFAHMMGLRRIVPPENDQTLAQRLRWLQGYDAHAYKTDRARTRPHPDDQRRD